MNEILPTLFRSVLAFALLMILTRFMGRKAISQVTFFDFAVAITLGSIGGNLSMTSTKTVYSPAVALIALSSLAVLTDYFHIRSLKFSKMVLSEPVVLIANGKIVDGNMNNSRISIMNLTALLRQKNAFNIADVEFAILESDGKLSVLPKSQKQPLTPSDMNIPTSYKGLTRDIIINGSIMYENLRDVNLDEAWLRSQLETQGCRDIRNVFYAGLDTFGNLYVSKRGAISEDHGKYGIE